MGAYVPVVLVRMVLVLLLRRGGGVQYVQSRVPPPPAPTSMAMKSRMNTVRVFDKGRLSPPSIPQAPLG